MGVGKPAPVSVPVPMPTPGGTPIPLPIPVPGLPVATTTQSGDRVQSVTTPSETADWRVNAAGDGFAIDLPAAGGQVLAVAGDGTIVMRAKGAAGQRGRFAFVGHGGCPAYPEVDLDVDGAPRTGAAPWSTVHGLIDGHMHMMAFEFLGGRIHCGRPWHPYGAPYALVDCPDHYPNGAGAAAENVLSYGNPAHTHDPVGWPTFKDWPSYPSLTHEQSYYRWLERSWRAGQRVFVNLLVDNAVLCELYPLKKNSCNEMDGVRLQARRIHELQDYIDAQHGGPGKGWFRIVTTPYQARRVINQGKLAVVLGIEVSKLFDCGLDNERPECTAPQIDQRLDEVYDMGVRDMELVNALAGVAGDSGTTGVVVNSGNRIETGKYWQMTSCDGHNHVQDRTQYTVPAVERDTLAGNVLAVFGPTGAAPLYPPAPHCNVRGLSELGAHLVQRMIAKKMIVDPDHLSVRARQQLLDIVEEAKYSGIISSHSWSTADAIPRIYRLGPGRRLGRGHERLRLAGAAAQRPEPGHLSVQELGRDRHRAPAAQRPSGLRHQQGRRRPVRPLSRLGRGPAPPRRAADRRRPRSRRRGLPADVGARRRRPDRLPPGAGEGVEARARGRAPRGEHVGPAAARRPAAGARRTPLELVRGQGPRLRRAHADGPRRVGRRDRPRLQGARRPPGEEDEARPHDPPPRPLRVRRPPPAGTRGRGDEGEEPRKDPPPAEDRRAAVGQRNASPSPR
jgi:hypothetical protein